MSMAIERNLLFAAVAGIVLLLATGVVVRRRGIDAWSLTVAGLLPVLGLLLAALSARWLRESQGPFLTLYDVLLSNLFSLTLVYLVATGLVPALRKTAIVVVAMLAVLGSWALSVSPDAIPLPATYDNPWLWLHVLSGKLFLGLCMLAAAAALLLLRAGAGNVPSAAAGNAVETEDAVWLTLSLAFVCHSFMLIAGSIWAHSAWGRYWSWDSLETWTFVTWLCIALLLHARVTFRRMPPAYAWSAVIAIFCLAVLTFLGMPFVSVAPHKGVM